MNTTFWIVVASLTLVFGAWFLVDFLQLKEPAYRVRPILARLQDWFRLAFPLETHPAKPFSPQEMTQIRTRSVSVDGRISSFGVNSRSQRRWFSNALAGSPEPNITSVMVGSQAFPRVNIGALGFGPVNQNVIRSLALAAAGKDCLLNTGEDGITKFHRESGARLIWQVGPGLWGCRDGSGEFDERRFHESLNSANVFAVEIKLTQGAKPGFGGFVPALKMNSGVAQVLGVEPDRDCVSPAFHVGDLEQVAGFCKRVDSLTDKAVGIKVAIGSPRRAKDLVGALLKVDWIPAFVHLDSGEGGTGGAPWVLQAGVGLPSQLALPLLYSELRSENLNIPLFVSSKVWNGLDVARLIHDGADGVFLVRSAMLAMGCRQTMQCHTGGCLSGIAAHDWRRSRAIDPGVQSNAVENLLRSIDLDLTDIMRGTGVESPEGLRGVEMIGLDA